MKILKYQKTHTNEYKIITSKETYKLYDDIIIKYELLLKKEVGEQEFAQILKENNLLKAYYESLKAINTKLRTEMELKNLLKKKQYNLEEINYAITRLNKEGYLNHQIYIEAYIHDILNLHLCGEAKILADLQKLGFKEEEITPYLAKVEPQIYLNKIEKYITKKLKANRGSANNFKRKTLSELLNKGFSKSDILAILDHQEITEDPEIIALLVNKLYTKYIKKYDLSTTKLKIKNYLYTKGYTNIDLDLYLKKTSD